MTAPLFASRARVVKPLLAASLALVICGGISAAEGDKPAKEHEKTAAAKVEQATATGTVTAVDTAKHSVTVKEDGSDETNDYRAYFKDGNSKPRLEQISKLKVGDRVTISYTENEGRRIVTLEEAKPVEAKK